VYNNKDKNKKEIPFPFGRGAVYIPPFGQRILK